MERFKRAPGLTLFCTIWLLVLILPIWRLRAARHWENSRLMPTYTDGGTLPSVKLGFTPQDEKRLAQQFPDEPQALLWQHEQEPHVTEPRPGARPGAEPGIDTDKFYQGYIDLSRRFPDNLAIRSQWLRDACLGSFGTDDNAIKNSSKMDNTQPPLNIIRPPSMSKRQRLAALDCAIAGAKLDPTNAYWPWMQAIFAFSLRREDQGLAALKAAGKCTGYDDGTRDSIIRETSLMHRVQLTDTEDEFQAFWNILLPHYSKLRQAAREAMWNAGQSYKRGDKRKALEIADSVQMAGEPICDGKGSFIGFLVGKAIVKLAWTQTLDTAGIDTRHLDKPAVVPPDPAIEQAQLFADLARKEGNEGVANRTMQVLGRIGPQSVGGQVAAAGSLEFTQGPLYKGLSRMLANHWLEYWLLRLSWLGAVAWLVTYAITRGKSSLPTEARRSVAVAAAFSLGITGALLWNVLRSGLGGYLLFQSSPDSGNDITVESTLPLCLMAAWIIPPLFPMVRSRLRLHAQTKNPNTIGFWPALLLAVVMSFALVMFSTMHRPYRFSYDDQTNFAILLIFNFSTLGALYFMLRGAPRSRKIYVGLFEAALLCFTTFMFLTGAQSDIRDAETQVSGDMLVSTFFVGAIIFSVLGVYFSIRAADYKRAFRNEFLREILQRLRIAAAALAVFGSLAYFGVGIESIPIRSHVQSLLERQLKIGEIASIQEQIKSK